MKIKFTKCAVRKGDGETLYRLEIAGETVREDLTLDEVIEAINRRDEEKLGEAEARIKGAVVSRTTTRNC